MDAVNFYNFLGGYVKIKVTGRHIERFLNLATGNNAIYIWDIRKISAEEAELKISVKGFKRIRKYAYKTKSKIVILERCGAFKYIKSMKTRKILITALIAALALITFTTSLILKIEVVGTQTVEKAEIYKKLEEIGLKKGVFRSKIDDKEISVKLINDIDNISWVGVYEEGTRLVIEIKERKAPPPIIDKYSPCKIVAAQDAVVRSITATNGNAAVGIGQTVSKGDLLVTGIINTKHDGIRTVHAAASVIGQTWHSVSDEAPLFTYEKEYSGNSMKKYSVSFRKPENIFTFFDRDIPYNNYDEKTNKFSVGLLTLYQREYTEYTLLKKERSREDTEKYLREQLEELLYKDVKKGDVKSIELTEEPAGKPEHIRLKLTAECEEEIAEEAEISAEELSYREEQMKNNEEYD